MGNFYEYENKICYDAQTNEKAFDETQMREAFAKSLRDIRKYCKLSTIQLAEAIDVPQPTISCYENNLRTPSFVQALKITAYFGLTVEEFVLCGLGVSSYDVTELYEIKNNN